MMHGSDSPTKNEAKTSNACRRRQKGKGRGTSRTLYWDKHRMILGVLVTLFDDCGKSLFPNL